MIEVYDDFLPEILFEDIERFLTDYGFSWNYLSNSVNTTDNDYYDDGLTRMIFSDGRFSDEFIQLFPSIYFIEEKLGLDVHRLARIKANLTLSGNSSNKQIPHQDLFDEKNYKTGILYINDSDGTTTIYDSKDINDLNNGLDSLKIKEEIKPKRNRFVIFDGPYLHRGNKPKEYQNRILINFNWFTG